MDKLLEMLGVHKLNEQEQGKIKEKLETLIELKTKEALTEKLEVEKGKLVEEYEEKFETYKDDITSKFSNFVDEILDEQMNIPEKVLEFARKGELYSDLIEQFKVRLGIDEGLLDEEVKSLLKEAKKEIQSLRQELDESTAEKLETKSDAQSLAAELYIRKKCDGLTVEQSNHVIQMLEGSKDKNEIDRKFSIILEAYNGKGDEDDGEGEDEKDKKKKKKDGEDDEDVKESKKDGRGKVINEQDEENNEDKDLEESDSPFNSHLKRYLSVLKENRV
jgi:hypothetical protein